MIFNELDLFYWKLRSPFDFKNLFNAASEFPFALTNPDKTTVKGSPLKDGSRLA